ncbi:hypothetical protein SAMN05880501_103116 [Ureibacillus xyleni]|uniref:Helix-turn-helix protein n=2 Tax=Ureibacillus xyleni TaxID=614648 RepID=A0A285S6Q3_9BACL|nr:hypothetical protein SAMN05880501_103116 [Ureibacillus xyleni]
MMIKREVNKKQFNEKFIEPVRALFENCNSINNHYFLTIPQPISRCLFFSNNNVYAVFTILLTWFGDNGKWDVSRSVLAKQSRVTTKTVDKAINELVVKGFIRKKVNIRGNEKDFNTYILNDLTKNPFLILSEAIYTVENSIKNVKTDKAVELLVKPLNKENTSSILIECIKDEASKDSTKAFHVAYNEVSIHFEKTLGIEVGFIPKKKKSAKLAENKRNTVTFKRNREWNGAPSSKSKPKIRLGGKTVN